MRGALGLLVQDVVSGVSQQRPVVCVEEHFLRAPVGLALTLRTAGVEEEDVAVTVTGSDVEMVRTPLGIIDSPVTLAVNVVVMLEDDRLGLDVPNDEIPIVGPRHQDIADLTLSSLSA